MNSVYDKNQAFILPVWKTSENLQILCKAEIDFWKEFFWQLVERENSISQQWINLSKHE